MTNFFNLQDEQANINEVNKPPSKINTRSEIAAQQIVTEFLHSYQHDPAQAARDWSDIRAQIKMPEQFGNFGLIDQTLNERAIDPLLQQSGKLFAALDTAKSGGDADGNISKGDMEAWLQNSANINDPNRQFIQQLHDGKVLNVDGKSVLNGDGGIDIAQLGRLTGNTSLDGGYPIDFSAQIILGNNQSHLDFMKYRFLRQPPK
ncbi:MAG: hypothetical protein JST89_21010 [Cyanobacteria bacterium SZAS-4]|nr:hypothetical protein [Cyanobacteria bacterium SZAS-4]